MDHHASRKAFDFIDRIQRMKTQDEVMHGFSKELEDYGLTSWLITGLPGAASERISNLFILSGYPTEWMDHYVRMGYSADDPVAAHAKRAPMPFEWTEAPVPTAKAKEVMDISGDFGLPNGFIVPVRRGSTTSVVTMSGERPQLKGSAKPALHMMALYAHARAEEIKNLVEGAPMLTAREREVLTWCAVGKTDWEIGVILSVSETTVDRHLRSAAGKLGTRGRTATAVAALVRGELAL